MNAIVAIALNTFRETVRERVVYAFMLFAAAITVASIMLGTLSIGQDVRILEDMGMAAISLIGGAIAVFVGTNLVYKELDRRTIYIIFTKPVTGWQFILGKYLGLSLCIMLIISAMGLFLAFLVWSCTHTGSPGYFMQTIVGPLALVYLELLFVIASAVFFSTFASPIMSVIFTLAIWLIAHFGESLKSLGQMSQSPVFAKFSETVYLLLPDLSSLTKVRSLLMYGEQAPKELLAFVSCYVLGYIVLLLVVGSVVTEQREFP